MTSVYELVTFNYKGETCPIPRTERFRNNDVKGHMMRLGQEIVIENLREGLSIPTQILIFKETLDTLDKSLIETSNGGEINEDTLEIAAQQVKFDIDNKEQENIVDSGQDEFSEPVFDKTDFGGFKI